MEEALTSLLASVAGGRRYWVRAAQGAARPYVVLNVISAPRDYHTRGASGYVQSRVQCDCYGDTYSSTKTTARAVRAATSGVRSGAIQGIFVETERDLPDGDAGPAANQPVNNLFRISVDLIIHHIES